MLRSVWAVLLMLLASIAGAQQREPGVPDIPAMQALWANLKAQLAGPNGEKYFQENLRNAELPYLYGMVLSSTPTPKDQTRVLVLAMSDKSTPEVALSVEPGHLTEGVRDGAEVIFQGVATAFSKQPFRLTISTSEAVRVHDSR
jgi:hypothetical protein